MTSASPSRGMSPAAVLLGALLLLLLGAGAAVWSLARYPEAARLLGVARPNELPPPAAPAPVRQAAPLPSPVQAVPAAPAVELAPLEARIARIESMTARAEGSALRADALLIAFAARRAIDRGVALGYLEPLLSERFGTTHPRAVATIVTASRRPVRLDQLRADFAALEARLKAPPPEAGLWQNIRRELGGLVSIRRADQPSQRPSPTFERAEARLAAGQVDQALAEAMRLPGIGAAPRWVADARTYVAAHRALDEIESAALLVR
jgi:hypothetical protein